MAAALGAGACDGLTSLDLGFNEIGEGWAATVAMAIGGGGCGGLMMLNLGRSVGGGSGTRG